MEKFIEDALNKAYQKGGKTYTFVNGCVARAENYLVKGCTYYTDDEWGMKGADNVTVALVVYAIPDLKLWKYQANQDKIISELNYLLVNKGYQWTITRLDNFFRTTKLVYFALTRPKSSYLDVGMSSLWQSVRLIGQLLIMKGFYILSTQVKDQNGKLLLLVDQSYPTQTDLHELQGLLSYSEMEDIIDEIVEGEVKEEAKPKLSWWEQILAEINKIKIAIIIVFVGIVIVYLLEKGTKIAEITVEAKKAFGKVEEKVKK